METEKIEILKDCKILLRLVNCEAVIDTQDETLYDILFKSHVKKKMLLSWLIQQLYSAECCANSSFEDLMSMFISKEQLPVFLSGKMPMVEQYKRWKLIMDVLYQRRKRETSSFFIDIDREIESGALLAKYENIGMEKFESNLNYIGLVSAKEKKLKTDELRSQLEKLTADNARLSSSPVAQISVLDDGLFSSDSHKLFLETLRNTDIKLNHIIQENQESLVPKVSLDQLKIYPKYEELNSRSLSDTKTKLRALKENTGIFSKLIHGVENLQF